MKKLSLFVDVALAVGFSSCSGQSSKGNLENSVDSLSYAIGMARTQGLDQFLMQQGIDSAHVVDFVKGFNEGATKLDSKDAAYIIGLQVGQMVSKQWVEGFNRQIFGNDSTQTLSREQMLAGFVAGTLGREDVMTRMQAQTYMSTEMDAIREKTLAVEFADNKAAGEKFLAENKTKEGVQTTPSGLQYKIITKGNGPVPADTNRVQVNYRGTLIDGTEFDSCDKRKDKKGKRKTDVFSPKQVIKGWGEALTMMPVGSKWELYIPYELAYGSRNTGKIKPFSALIFEVEVVGIAK